MQLTGQWADSVQLLEKLYFLRLAVWGGLATVFGTSLLAYARRRGSTATLLSAFTTALAGVGAVILVFAVGVRQIVPLRDHASVIALDRVLWAAVGAATAIAISSLVQVVLANRRQRRTDGDVRTAAAHVALILHALAIAVLSGQLATAVVR